MRKFLFCSSLTILLSLLMHVNLRAQEVPATPPTAPSEGEAQTMADRERAQREGQLREAILKQGEGETLFKQGKYKEAIDTFEAALKLTPPGFRAEATRATLRARIADAYATWAEAIGNEMAKRPLADRNWDDAISKAKTALAYNPEDKNIQSLLADLEYAKVNPPPPIIIRGPAPDRTPERIEQRVTLSEKLRRARVNLEAGYLDEAEQLLNEILLEDKYNIAAYQFLKKVYERRAQVDEVKRRVASTRYLEDIDRRWLPKIEKPRIPASATTTIAARVSPVADMVRRLNEIVIDEVNFRDADIAEVITFLSEQSRLKDPNGVNIILRDVPQGRTIRSLRLRNIKLIEVLKVITDLVDMKFVVEQNAVVIVNRDSPYGQDLQTRTYPVDPVLISRVATPILPPGVGGDLGDGAARPIQGGAPGGVIPLDSATIISMLKDLGVPFPPGSQAKYLPTLSRLVVTNTPENLEILEKLLADLNVGSNQVSIETKFLEVSEAGLSELGFQWYLGEFPLSRVTRNGRPTDQVLFNAGQGSWPPSVLPPGAIQHGFTPQGTPTISGTGSIEIGGNPFTPGVQTNNFTGGLRDLSVITIGAIESLLGGAGAVVDDRLFSIGGVLTKPQFQVIVKALSRSSRTNLLSTPQVTTILGQPATIKIVTEFIYPTRFREPQAVAAAGGVQGSAGVAVTPSTPTSFATREVGVLLTVTPVLGADGYTINLSLNPEVSEFLGFIDYGGKIQIPASGAPQGFVEVDNKITQPIFATRSVLTNVAIWDGQTVVLGGLAREDVTEINDKIPFFGDIPFLGRLFRSKGKSTGKRNLIIFVTATLIDPAGNRIHPEGTTGGPYIMGAPAAPADAAAPVVP